MRGFCRRGLRMSFAAHAYTRQSSASLRFFTLTHSRIACPLLFRMTTSSAVSWSNHSSVNVSEKRMSSRSRMVACSRSLYLSTPTGIYRVLGFPPMRGFDIGILLIPASPRTACTLPHRGRQNASTYSVRYPRSTQVLAILRPQYSVVM